MDKKRKNRLRWFGRVKKRKEMEAVKMVLEINVEEKLGRGKLEKSG